MEIPDDCDDDGGCEQDGDCEDLRSTTPSKLTLWKLRIYYINMSIRSVIMEYVSA